MKKITFCGVLSLVMLWSYIGFVMYLFLGSFENVGESIFPESILGISFDKIVHFTIFVLFSIILSIYRKFHPNTRWMRKDIVILLIAILFAFTTEVSQLLFATHRSFEFADIFSDIYGAVFGLLLVKITQRKKVKEERF